MKWILMLLVFVGGVYYLINQDKREKQVQAQAEQIKQEQKTETLPVKSEKVYKLKFSAETVKILRGLTQDSNEKVRFASAELLWQLQDEQAPSVIKRMFQEETDASTKHALIAMLAADKSRISLALLAEALGDYETETRVKAVEAIAGFTNKEAIPVLGRALDDYDEDVKLKAIESINRIRKDLETQKEQELRELQPQPLFSTK